MRRFIEKKRIIITKRGHPIAEVRAIVAEVRAIEVGDEKVPLKDTLVFMGDVVSPVAEEDWEVLR